MLCDTQDWRLSYLWTTNAGGELRPKQVKKKLKKLFELKAKGAEEDYIAELQRAGELRKFFERLLKENVG